jgi:hypothetical protein
MELDTRAAEGAFPDGGERRTHSDREDALGGVGSCRSGLDSDSHADARGIPDFYWGLIYKRSPY